MSSPEEVRAAAGRAAARRVAADRAEARSLDLVQRLIISALLVVVIGVPAISLAIYSPHLARTDRGTAVGLWVMSAVLGLMAALGVLLAHRGRPYSPLLLIGLAPAAVSAYFLF